MATIYREMSEPEGEASKGLPVAEIEARVEGKKKDAPTKSDVKSPMLATAGVDEAGDREQKIKRT